MGRVEKRQGQRASKYYTNWQAEDKASACQRHNFAVST